MAFLRDRKPFSLTFSDTTARDFYAGVRCGLLHEARTKNGWKVWAGTSIGQIADPAKRIVYRDGFQAGLLSYIKEYGTALQADAALQSAFIRKFDDLCR